MNNLLINAVQALGFKSLYFQISTQLFDRPLAGYPFGLLYFTGLVGLMRDNNTNIKSYEQNICFFGKRENKPKNNIHQKMIYLKVKRCNITLKP